MNIYLLSTSIIDLSLRKKVMPKVNICTEQEYSNTLDFLELCIITNKRDKVRLSDTCFLMSACLFKGCISMYQALLICYRDNIGHNREENLTSTYPNLKPVL